MCKKDLKGVVLFLAIGILAPVVHAQAVNISGTVVDSATSTAIANALVKLIEVPGCTTRTNSAGAFTLATTVSTAASSIRNHSGANMTFGKNSVSIAGLPGIENVVIAGFSLGGARLFRIENMVNGACEIALPNQFGRPGICLVTVSVAGRQHSVLTSGFQNVSIPINPPETGALQKTTATYSIQIAANGYRTKNIEGLNAQGNIGTVHLAKNSAQVGIWTKVSPSDMILNNLNNPTNGNYGAIELMANPVKPGVLYAFACYQACWRSTDYGETWTKFSAGDDFLGSNPSIITVARPVGGAIAQDGSYMVICSIYPSFPPNSSLDWPYRNNYGWDCVWISRENGPDSALGKYWELVSVGALKACRIAIDPEDKNHLVVSTATFDLIESTDAGRTWLKNPNTVMPEEVCDLVFVNAHELLISVPNDGGSYRADRTGAYPWTWTITKISNQSAGHTMWIPFIDTVGKHLYFPGAGGITKSTDLTGSSWTTIGNVGQVRTLVATPTRFYCGNEFPTDGYQYPNLRHASRSNETVWTTDSMPPAMTNGPVYMQVLFDGSHYILVSCNWMAGVWRYIEP